MDVDEKYFNNISKRERAIFEGAITMGALFHQFIGTPVSIKSVVSLEKSIENAMELQPCINRVKIKINREILKKIENEYDYISLTGEMLDVKVVSDYSDKRAVIRLKYISELKYPLMYVEAIE
ncbi:MAG TPA: dihydroneopterin aldolase family protein [Methanobacterium sp.]|nr:dihydroneopterin aldolase family protein [Methanobacterium sp.]